MNQESTLKDKAEAPLKEGERELSRTWKLIALQGVFSIVFAVVILVWPSIGLTTLLALFGVLAIIWGFMTGAAAFNVPMPTRQRVWLSFGSLVAIAVGVVVFVWPDLSARGLLFAIGAFAVSTGIIQGLLAFALPYSGGRSLLMLLGGLISIAFGVVMFAHPGAGALAVLALVAAFALVMGVMQIALAVELERVARKLKEPFRKPHSTAKPVAQA